MKNDLPELLRYIVVEMAQGARFSDSDANILQRAADEIERLQSIVGAVSPGQSLAEIKEHLRTLHKDKADGSRESNAN